MTVQPPPPPSPAPTPPSSRGIAWERLREVGPVSGFLGTAGDALFRPVEFFRRVDPHGPLGPPLLYAIAVALVSFVAQMLYSLAIPNPFTAWMPAEERVAETVGPLVVMGVGALMIPVVVPIVIFVMSAVYHGLLLLFGGPVRGFSGTVRASAYASSAQLAAMIPFCGALIGLVWGVVLQVIGLREVHGVSTGKAVAAVLVPFLLCAVAVLAGIALILAMIAGAAASSA